MKKLTVMFLSLLLIFVFAGCHAKEQQLKSENKGNETAVTKKAATEKTATNESSEQKHETAANPEELKAEDLCYFCNMKIYTKDEEMGVYTAQAIKEDGTHVYFDDSGCMLNAQRKYNEKFVKQWVRDFNTTKWIEANSAVVVKADVQSPMKYGYAFFKDQEAAKPYLENPALNAVVSSWDPIDQEAEKRYQAKMQKEAEMKSNGTMENQENMNMDM